MAADFVKTYINGFDEELGGGIPKEHVVLLAGVPGSLKSTIAFNMAYKNFKNDNIKVLYLVLDKSKDKLLAQMAKFNMDTAGIGISLYDIATIRSNLSHYKGVNWWEPLRAHIKELKYSMDFGLIIIDSVQMLETVVQIPDLRRETATIFKWIQEELKVTGILISEMPFDSIKFSNYNEDILADGIIHVSTAETEAGMERRIRCVKMGHVAHSTNYFRLSLRDGEPVADKISTVKRPGGAAQSIASAPPSSDSFSF